MFFLKILCKFRAPCAVFGVMTDDKSLLRRFVKDGDEAAFTDLVGRYLGMVHGICRRRTGDSQLAEELAQNVFAALARKAGSIRGDVLVAGWLHRAACLESLHALRSEASRKRTMKRFKELQPPETGFQELPPDLVPVLDEAMSRLAPADRDIVLMRFASGLSLRQIGDALGKSESGSQRHLQRALEKLCGLLRKQGVTVGLGALATFLGTDLAKAAPVSLVTSTISKSAIAQSAAGGVSIFTLLTTTHILMKQKAIITTGICLVLAAGTAIYRTQSASKRDSTSDRGSPPARAVHGIGGEAGKAAPDGLSTQRVRQRSEGQDSELVKRFSESRVKVAKNVTGNFIYLMDLKLRFIEISKSDKRGSANFKIENRIQTLDDLYAKLQLNDSQRVSVDALVAKHLEPHDEAFPKILEKLRASRDQIVEILLAGDAVDRGELSSAEFEALLADNNELLSLAYAEGMEKTLLGDESAWELILDERQMAMLNGTRDDMIRETSNGGMRLTEWLLKPTNLEKVDDQYFRERKVLDAMLQLRDATDAMKDE